MAPWDPCPGSKSTSVSRLRNLALWLSGNSQLGNFSLQSSC